MGRLNASKAQRAVRVTVLTPVALDRDSRTLKQVLSMRRWGYSVRVVAAGRVLRGSELERLGSRPTPVRGVAVASCPSRLRRWWSALRRERKRRVVHRLVFGGWLLLFWWRWFARIAWRIPHASVYVLHEYSQFPALRLALHGRPLVYDAHDFYTGIDDPASLGPLDRDFLLPFARRLEAACVRRASRTLTVSPSLARLYRDAYGVEATVLRNVHDARLDEVAVPPLRERFGLADNSRIVVVIGNWKRGQRFDGLLDALTVLPDNVHLVLMGDGYDALETGVRTRALSERVHDLGPIAPTRMVPLAASADASAIVYFDLSDNYRGALPNGFFQSIAAGLPLLYPPLPEIRREAQARGLGVEVDWSSSRAVRDAVARFLEDSAFVEATRERVRSAYRELCWEREEETFRRVLDEVMRAAQPLSARGRNPQAMRD